MCGLFGVIHKKEFLVNENEFLKNLDILNNRGPDFTGFDFFNNKNFSFKFGHKRLSILDLSREGNQPFKTKNGSILIFNGEIYNHYSIRRIIEKNIKVSWKGTSDTETLIQFLENFSIDVVLENLEGMFSFIYYNKKNNKIIFTRDLAGEKPLYFHVNKNYINFSSTLSPIAEFKNFEKQIDHKSLSNYKKYSYIPFPNTVYKSVFKLPPASYMIIDLNNFDFKNFMNFKDLINCKGISFKEWWHPSRYLNQSLDRINQNFGKQKKILKNNLTQSVDKQLISDVPLGAFLSGGIDSSLIVSIASKLKNKLNTFTIGFDFSSHD